MRPALLALLLVACADPDAPAKCEEMINAICANTEENCTPTLATEDCVAAVEEEFDCDNAVDVSEDYEDCLEYIEDSESCVVNEELPSECDDAVLYAE